MIPENIPHLRGRQGLVTGIANEHSIAFGCAKAFRVFGAEDLAVTYPSEKAKPHVAPLACDLGAGIFHPLDVRDDAQMDALFEEIAIRWGRLDFLVHSIAFAPRDDLHGRVTDCSRDGFLAAMDISCHSLLRLARRAEPLMTEGGAIFAMSYLGAERVVENYGLMGPVKAALEASVRALAVELAEKGIRVHAISPGPVPTRAASGLAGRHACRDRRCRRDLRVSRDRCRADDHRRDALYRRRAQHPRAGVEQHYLAGQAVRARRRLRAMPPIRNRAANGNSAAAGSDIATTGTSDVRLMTSEFARGAGIAKD